MRTSTLVFDPSKPALNGTSGPDILRGTEASEIIDGGLGDDRLYANGGDDTLIGSLGRDVLDGGSGTNTFLYTHLTQSYYAGNATDHADLIRNFDTSNNLIDVSALGFYGLGNGHADTLLIAVNDAGTRTYVKSYGYDEGGDRFEIAFDGDVTQYLTEGRIVFAGTGLDTVSIAVDQVQPSETVNIEPRGVLPESTSGVV